MSRVTQPALLAISLLACLPAANLYAADIPPESQTEKPRWRMLKPAQAIQYPPLPRHAGIAGELTLRLKIREMSGNLGEVESVEVVAGHPIFTLAVESAAKHWAFARVKGGKSDWFFTVVEFQLSDYRNQDEGSGEYLIDSSVSYWKPPNRVIVQGGYSRISHGPGNEN
jgi:hypothetical protein